MPKKQGVASYKTGARYRPDYTLPADREGYTVKTIQPMKPGGLQADAADVSLRPQTKPRSQAAPDSRVLPLPDSRRSSAGISTEAAKRQSSTPPKRPPVGPKSIRCGGPFDTGGVKAHGDAGPRPDEPHGDEGRQCRHICERTIKRCFLTWSDDEPYGHESGQRGYLCRRCRCSGSNQIASAAAASRCPRTRSGCGTAA